MRRRGSSKKVGSRAGGICWSPSIGQIRLTLTFPDMFEEADAYNPLAAMLQEQLRHPKIKSNDVFCGAACLSKEAFESVVDFANKL